MAISAAARKNHDEPVPRPRLDPAGTDPELIEVFDNFAFDEVLRHGTLEARTRLMVQLAAMIASQALGEYRVMLGAALTVGVTPVEVKEIVYQAVPYVGLAKVFDFLHATNDVLTDRGIALPLPGSPRPPRRPARRRVVPCRKRSSAPTVSMGMYAERPRRRGPLPALPVGQLLRRPPHAHRHRPARPRELLTLSMLVSLGGCDPQVEGHVAANLNVGNDRGRLLDVITQLLPFIGYPRTLNALRVINDVAPGRRTNPAGTPGTQGEPS